MPALSRKTVTVLFSDVVDWTPLGESLDPEQVRALMSRYFAEMRTVIERHGGSVEKYIGDAIMAVFGIPHVHEDDALRAVRAAHEMRAALAELNRELPDPLAIRTGLATGEVVTGEGDTLVTGDTVNLAARLEQAAQTDEILIAETTQQLVRDAVVAERVESLVLKGKKEPVAAWRVTDVHPRKLGRARRFATTIVGREEELALLRQAYARSLASRGCHLFTLLGTAGVGKSRLARAFLREIGDEASVLIGRCLPYGEGITFWPLREVVHTLGDLRIYVDDADAAVIETAVGARDMQVAPEETSRAVRHLVEAVARDLAARARLRGHPLGGAGDARPDRPRRWRRARLVDPPALSRASRIARRPPFVGRRQGERDDDAAGAARCRARGPARLEPRRRCSTRGRGSRSPRSPRATRCSSKRWSQWSSTKARPASCRRRSTRC